MVNFNEVLETNRMIEEANLDVRTITMGISLLDCAHSDYKVFQQKVYDKITHKAEKLVETGEGSILQTYDYIPMLQNASVQLLSQKAYYVVDEFNPVLSFGGIEYLKYNYDDAEWAAYVASQGGELTY